AAVSGEDRLGAPEGLADVETALRRSDFAGATLGGVQLKPTRGGVALTRDRGAVLGRAGGQAAPPALALPLGDEVVWDGRLALRAQKPGWRLEADARGDPELVFGATRMVASPEVEARWLLAAHAAHRLSSAVL